MDFSQRQARSGQHAPGVLFVIFFHIFIVYALVTGLAKKVVDVVRAPIETKVIEEIKKPPPDDGRRQRSSVSGGGGEHDSHHTHDPKKKGGGTRPAHRESTK